MFASVCIATHFDEVESYSVPIPFKRSAMLKLKIIIVHKRAQRKECIAHKHTHMHGRFVICWFSVDAIFFFHSMVRSSVVATWFLSHSYKLHFHFICAYMPIWIVLFLFRSFIFRCCFNSPPIYIFSENSFV